MVGLFLASLGLMGCTRDPGPPGVLLVTIDTWRADHMGHATHIAQLPGRTFTDAWTPIGLTTPAHATLLTGRTPPQHGLRANNHHGYALPAAEVTVAERFADAGYATAAFVSAWPAGPDGGMDQGFQVFDGPESGERATSIAVDGATRWLEGREGDWFLWVHAYDPHGPYTPLDGTAGDDRTRYAAEIAQADRLLKPLIDDAMARGSTIVITSDHGEVLDEERCGVQHERSSSEHVLRVPMILVGPGIEAGTNDRRVGLDDVMPTLLHRAGLEDPRDDLLTVEREVWVGESGLCDPECAIGCAPDGVLGKDRIVYGPESTWLDRPGRKPKGDAALAPHLADWPPPVAATGATHVEQATALGYMAPPDPE
ncbi:MAG: sulfatase [Proteobacteria bacterium]|nr:sulfatase [Pseudomonadota bacterium]MCP4917754.1 sulfatase [Pseudomonadota bacterium]